jgi:hypothetical protein
VAKNYKFDRLIGDIREKDYSSKIVKVSKEGWGGDYRTVKDALDSITDNSSTNRYVIKIAPGVYEEENPLQCKQYVSIHGEGELATRIDATVSSADVFTADDRILFKDMTIRGGVCAISLSAVSDVLVNNVTIFNSSDKGICVSDGSRITCNDLSYVATDGEAKVIDNLGSIVNVWNLNLVGQSPAGVLIETSGTGAVSNFWNAYSISTNLSAGFICHPGSITIGYDSQVSFADDGVRMYSDSQCNLFSCAANYCKHGIHVDSDVTGVNIGLNSCAGLNSTEYDLFIPSPDTTVIGNGCVLSIDRQYINPNSTIILNYSDTKLGDEGFNVVGELHVGTPEAPSESVFGEGDSYTRGMLVYTYDGTDYVDASLSASTINVNYVRYPNTSADTAIYMASSLSAVNDVITHYGIKALIEEGADYGTGNIVPEYWNGSGWVEFNVMKTGGNSPYYPYANTTFDASGSFQIRYDANLVTDSWTKNDPVGVGADYYWTRYRISSPINSGPVIDQIKLHSSRSELNGNGWQEYFGTARGYASLPWDPGLLEAANASPGNQDLFVGDNLAVGRRENLFANGGTDRLGFVGRLPEDLDTSTPIRFQWSVASNNSGGDILWKLRWTYSSDGDPVFFSAVDAPTSAVNEQQTIYTATAPTSADVQKWYRSDIDVSDLVSRRTDGFPDSIWVTLERTGGAIEDTHDGNVALINIAADYLKWCEGGHIG